LINSFKYEFEKILNDDKMNKPRISIQIDEDLKKSIENAIRQNYPKLKTVSDVVRTALKQFLEGEKP